MAYIKAQDRIGTVVNGFKILDVKREKRRTMVYVVCPYCKGSSWKRLDTIMDSQIISCGCQNKEKNWKKPKDISQKQFGRLTALYPTKKRNKNNGSIIWVCQCNCGNRVEVSEHDLAGGFVGSCGCLGKENSSINGKRVGKYVVDNHCVENTNIKNLTCKISVRNTSGVKGVSWDSQRQKWTAQIKFKGKKYYLGRYPKLEDATTARKEAEENLFGDFLRWYAETYPERWKKIQKSDK